MTVRVRSLMVPRCDSRRDDCFDSFNYRGEEKRRKNGGLRAASLYMKDEKEYCRGMGDVGWQRRGYSN